LAIDRAETGGDQQRGPDGSAGGYLDHLVGLAPSAQHRQQVGERAVERGVNLLATGGEPRTPVTGHGAHHNGIDRRGGDRGIGEAQRRGGQVISSRIWPDSV
jgi:hypothetical protein